MSSRLHRRTLVTVRRSKTSRTPSPQHRQDRKDRRWGRYHDHHHSFARTHLYLSSIQHIDDCIQQVHESNAHAHAHALAACTRAPSTVCAGECVNVSMMIEDRCQSSAVCIVYTGTNGGQCRGGQVCKVLRNNLTTISNYSNLTCDSARPNPYLVLHTPKMQTQCRVHVHIITLSKMLFLFFLLFWCARAETYVCNFFVVQNSKHS